jgi:predicted type IV restriction endonuclease
MSKEIKEEEKTAEPKLRRFAIETDGNIVKIVESELAGTLELRAILTSLMNYCDNPPKL